MSELQEGDDQKIGLLDSVEHGCRFRLKRNWHLQSQGIDEQSYLNVYF